MTQVFGERSLPVEEPLEAKIHRVDRTYHLYNTPLLILDHCKYLGVTLQSNLKCIKEKITGANSVLELQWRNIKSRLNTCKGSYIQSPNKTQIGICIYLQSGHRGNNFLPTTSKKSSITKLIMFLMITTLIPV